MISNGKPYCLEYNSRFGDPEAQVVLPLLETDLLSVMLACAGGTLGAIDIKWKNRAAACVVIASGGYPADYKTGYEINGIESIAQEEDLYCYHAGTAFSGDKTKYITNGGRVLCVTAIGENLPACIERARYGAALVGFKDAFYRKDIGLSCV